MKMYGTVEVKFLTFLILALGAGEWSVSHDFISSTHWIRGSVVPMDALDMEAKRKIPSSAGN
jgi:hypothetical protein